MVREEGGIAALYRGASISIMKTVPGAAIQVSMKKRNVSVGVTYDKFACFLTLVEALPGAAIQVSMKKRNVSVGINCKIFCMFPHSCTLHD
jgi:hypothetical protein